MRRSNLMTAMLSFDEMHLQLQTRYIRHTHATIRKAASNLDPASQLDFSPTPFRAPPDDEPTSLIDIGANLLDPQFSGQYHGKQKHEPDLWACFERAATHGVSHIIVTAGNLEESRAAQSFVVEQNRALAQAAEAAKGRENDAWTVNAPPPRLFTTVGVHPTHCLEFRIGSSDEDALAREQAIERHVTALDALVDHDTVVAVGELGLDYDRLHFCPADAQREGFEAQLKIAERTGKPLFLHSRASGADMAKILRAQRHRFRDGVVHSFDGSIEELKDLLDLNLFIGLNGCSLRTESNLEVVRHLPLERILLETDAPCTFFFCIDLFSLSL